MEMKSQKWFRWFVGIADDYPSVKEQMLLNYDCSPVVESATGVCVLPLPYQGQKKRIPSVRSWLYQDYLEGINPVTWNSCKIVQYFFMLTVKCARKSKVANIVWGKDVNLTGLESFILQPKHCIQRFIRFKINRYSLTSANILDIFTASEV
jgi:hypothetical protein